MEASVRKERNYVEVRNLSRGSYTVCCLIRSDSLGVSLLAEMCVVKLFFKG